MPQQAATKTNLARRVGVALMLVPLGWIAGTALQLQQRALSGAFAYGAAAGVAATLLLWAVWASRRAKRWVAPLWLIAALLLAWGLTGGRALLYQQQAIAPALEGVDLVLTGVVSAMPQHNPAGTRFDFEVERAEKPDGERITLPRQVRLAWYSAEHLAHRRGSSAKEPKPPEPHEGVRAGDRWRFTVRLTAPHGNVNPHGFDYELWLWERGIGATGYVRAGPRDAAPEWLGPGGAHPVERARQAVRDRILALAHDGDAGAAARAGVVAALVTGDQNAIDQPDWTVFRITGVAHLVAISGLHITMIAWLAALAVGVLWRRAARWRWLPFNPCLWWPAPRAALVGGLVTAIGYATFSGLGVPAQRTVLMLACVTLLRFTGLRWPWWLTWLWACALVLALDPWAFMQAGFWLSFVAIGILFISDGRAAESGRKSVTGYVRELLGTQAKVTVALAPLTLILFGQASVVGLLANLAAIPWVTLVVTPLALAGLVWPFLWQVALWAVLPLMAVLRTLASWPWAQVSVAAAPLVFGAAAALGALLLVLRWP